MPHVLTPQGYNQYVQSETEAKTSADIQPYQTPEHQSQPKEALLHEAYAADVRARTEATPSVKEREAMFMANIQRVGDEVVDMRHVAIEKAKNPAGPDFHEYGLVA